MIRSLEARDAGAWAAMRGRLWPGESTEGISVDAVFIADDEAGRPVGFIELSIREFADGCDSAPVPHVEGWFVEAHARRRGFGSGLMRAAEAWAREGGFTELASDTEVENVASQDAHARCGFEETERLVKFRKILG